MTVKELIELLSKLEQEKEIRYRDMIYDDVEISNIEDEKEFYIIV